MTETSDEWLPCPTCGNPIEYPQDQCEKCGTHGHFCFRITATGLEELERQHDSFLYKALEKFRKEKSP